MPLPCFSAGYQDSLAWLLLTPIKAMVSLCRVEGW
jgi:hypothetical protein